MAETNPESVGRLTAPSSATVTLEPSLPLYRRRLLKANAAPRCSGHSSRTGQPCRNPATNGMNVCHIHGARAPQVRAAAAIRLATVADPMVRELVLIGKNRKHPHQLQAIKEVLERNGLDAFGKPQDPKTAIYQPPPSTTTVNVTSLHLERLSDEELSLAERVFRGVIEASHAEPHE